MQTSPPLFTPALVLREFTLADAARVFAMSQEAGMRAWIPDQVYADEEAAREVLRFLIAGYAAPDPARRPYVLGLARRETGELVGHVGLSPCGDGVEIGYAVEERQQRRGLATQAVQAFTEWGLSRFGLPEVRGVVASANRASCAVLERAGFALVAEGVSLLHGQERSVRRYARPARGRSGGSGE